MQISDKNLFFPTIVLPGFLIFGIIYGRGYKFSIQA